MKSFALVSVLASSGCALVGDDATGVYGEDLAAGLQVIEAVGCPAFTPEHPASVAVLQDSVVIDGRVLGADIEPWQDAGVHVAFAYPQQWTVERRSIGVVLQLAGTATATELDATGAMSSAAPELAGCEVRVWLSGR